MNCGTSLPFLIMVPHLNPSRHYTQMLRRSRLKPGISAYEQVYGVNNYERTPLAPLGYKLQIHNNHTRDAPTLATQ